MSKEQPKFTIRPLEVGERIKPWCDFWINNGIPVFAEVAEKCCQSHCPHYRVTPQPQPESAEQGDPAKLQIVEGGYYRNRQGEKIGPMRWQKDSDSDNYPWCDEEDGYAVDGRYWFNLPESHPNDLIAPWTDPAAEAVGVEQENDLHRKIGRIMSRFVQRQDVPIGVRSEISTEARALVERVHELEKAIREVFVFSEMIDETLVIRLPYDVAKRVSGLAT